MNVFDLMATLALDRSAYNRGLNDAEREAQGFGSRLVGTLGGAAKAAGAALAAAGTGIASIAKQALSEYANYEQLVGGVDTLFGESADKIMKNAEQAFSTVGLSANQYMETVTSFSASLIQSTAGDTAKAADYADMALRDMADNANKMGTNMASIQNAYQGFAKQNYTMLDNLKLGYGGTKTEMLRLVEDAERLNSEFHAIRDENGDIALSYADVVEAIHIVQQEMGITGTTAAEAAGTITGSTAAVRAAWQNLLTGLGDETADLDKLVNNFTDTLLTNIGNMAPRIEKIISGIGRAAQKLIPRVFKEALKTVNKLLPDFVDSAKSLVADIGSVILEEAPDFIAAGVSIIADLGTQLGTSMPTLIPAIQQGIGAILQAAMTNAPALATAAITMMRGLAEGLINAIPFITQDLPKIIDGIVDFITNNVGDIVDAGITLFSALIQNVSAIVQAIAPHIPTLVSRLVEELTKEETIASIIDAGVTFFAALIDNIDAIISAIGNSLPSLVDGVVSVLDSEDNNNKIKGAGKTLFQHLVDDIPGITQIVGNAIVDIFAGVFIEDEDKREEFRKYGKFAVAYIIDGFKEAFDILFHPEEWMIVRLFRGEADQMLQESVDRLEQDSQKLWDAIEPPDVIDLTEHGKRTAQSLLDGYEQGINESDFEGITEDKMEGVVDSVNDALGIHSPSTVFAEIGRNTAAGLGVGFIERMSTIREGIIASVLSLATAVRNALGIHSPSTVWAEIGANMAQGLANGFKRTMEAEAAGINNSIPNGSNGVTGVSGGSGTHITQNVYAYQMSPAQAFAAAQQQAETAQFITAY